MANIDDWGNDLLFTPPSLPRLGTYLFARPTAEMSQPPDLTLLASLDPPTVKIDQWLCNFPEAPCWFHR